MVIRFINKALLPIILFTFLAAEVSLHASTLAICPTTIENDPPATSDACGVLLNVGSDLSVSATATGTLAYNGSDSTFGIVNRSNSVLNSLFLAGGDITNFTLDGITTYIPANDVAIPATPPIVFGYESYFGPNNTFSQVDRVSRSLFINFTGGLSPGAAAYFSLAGDPQTDVSGLTGPGGRMSVTAAAVPEPASWSLGALGIAFVIIGLVGRKKMLATVSHATPLLIAGVGVLLFSGAARANVIMLPSSPSVDRISAAKAAFANGSIVAMTDADPARFAALFNVTLPKPQGAPPSGPVRYYVIAAHRRANGSLHTYRGPLVIAGQNNTASAMDLFQTWANQEQLLQDNSPAPQAWTELSVGTWSEVDYANDFLQITIGVYRANSNNTDTDYYMITQQADDKPNFVHCLAGSYCGYIASSRNLKLSIDAPNSRLFDHGPTQVNNSTTASYQIGASISSSPSVSFNWTQSWNQQDVTTTDLTDLVKGTAYWNDIFKEYGSFTPNPSVPPASVQGLWTSYQAVIYTVPVGTPTFNVLVDASAVFYYNHPFTEPEHPVVQEINTIEVSPPRLSVFPQTLRVFPGQTATFDVLASISSGDGEQLPWTITNVPSGVDLSTTTGSNNQTIQLFVPAGTPLGQLGTLNIDTTASYASPDTRSGPIKLPVVIVGPSDVPPGVLVIGGANWTGIPQFSAEVWNPATGKSSVVASMQHARYLHTATPIPNDRILVAGGIDDQFNPVRPTEIYYEATQTFSAGPQLQTPRAWHTATFLNDGTVLIAGGQDASGNAIPSAEIYDPASNTTIATGNMTIARMKHTATLLPNGTVLIFGGASSVLSTDGLRSAEIYNPQTKSFSSISAPSFGYQSHAATLMSNGQVLIAGGIAGENVTIYNGSYFLSIPGSEDPATNGALVALPNISAMLLGGSAEATKGFLWDNSQLYFTRAAQMLEQRDHPMAVLIRNTNTPYDGSVFAAGGVIPNTGGSRGTAVEVNNPQNNTWMAAGAMTVARSQGTATLIGAIPVSSAVVLTSSLNPSISQDSVTFNVTVTAPGGTPSGTVTLNDGSTPIGGSQPLNNGAAQFSISSLSVGTHTIIATYNGGVGFAPGTSNAVTQVVNPIQVAPAFTNLTQLSPIPYGTHDVTLGGTISAPGPIYPGAGETVHVSVGGTGSPIPIGANGVFSLSGYGTGGFPVGTYRITYNYPGDLQLKPLTDSQTQLTIIPGTPAFSGLASPAPVVVGTATVHLSGKITYMSFLVPPGSVSITIGGTTLPAAINANDGTFALDFNTSSLKASATPYPITYSYAAAGNYNAASDASTSLTVNGPALVTTATAVTSSSGFADYDTPVTFTATVTSATTRPTGTVTFLDGSATLGTTALNAGTATFVISSLGVGTHSITAAYNATAGFAGSTSSLISQTINSLTAVFSDLTPSPSTAAGANVTLAGTIAAAPKTGPVLQFTQAYTSGGGGLVLPFDATGISTDSATWSMWIKTAVKTRQIVFQAAYTHPFITLENDQIGVIWDGAGAGWVSADTTPVSDGKWHHVAVSFNSGRITFYKDGIATSDSLAVATSAAASAPVNLGGTWSGIPSFVGEMWNAKIWASPSSASDVQADMFQTYGTVLPDKLRYSTVFNATANTATNAVTGETAAPTLAAIAIDAIPSRYPAAGEKVTVTIGSVPQDGTVGVNGSFTISFPTTGLTNASYPVQYSYKGNTFLTAALNSSTTLTIQTSSTTTTLTSSANPALAGASITFTATVKTANGTPTGQVSFLDGATPLSTPMLDSNGTATYTTSSLSPGQHNITAKYTGAGGYSGSTSAVLAQTVKANASFGGLTSPTPPAGTASYSFTGVLSAGSVYPDGSAAITVMVGSIQTGQAVGSAKPGANGAFAVPVDIGSLAAGTYAVRYSYPGDPKLNQAVDANTTLTVQSSAPASSQVVLTANPNPMTVGNTVTFTATVPQVGGIVPTGNVTISEPLGPNNVPIYGHADLVNGVATIVVDKSSPTQLTAGSHVLYATFGSSSSAYNSSTSLPYTVVVNSVGATPEKATVLITVVGTERSGGTLTVDLKIANTGNTPASDVTLTQVTVRTLTGTGAVSVVSTFPVAVGQIGPAESVTKRLILSVPATAQRISLNESGTLRDVSTPPAVFSLSQTVILPN